MKQYHVTGMSCAACSARVEKAVSGVPGVTACSVSLLTNSMGVEGTAADQAVIDAVQAAGYGASVKGAQQSANPAAGADALADPFGQHLAGIHVKHLILQRGAAGIDNQYFHRYASRPIAFRKR